jgi:hypothetical protein
MQTFRFQLGGDIQTEQRFCNALEFLSTTLQIYCHVSLQKDHVRSSICTAREDGGYPENELMSKLKENLIEVS